MDTPSALLLRHVTSRIGCREDAFRGAAFLADFDQADADADVEDLILPGEVIVRDGLANVLRYLQRLVEWTTCEQHRELIAADARNGIGVADAALEQSRDLAQQVVAGDVAAGVVDRLEAVEIEIRHDVADAFAPRGLERRFEPALELGAVDEAR